MNNPNQQNRPRRQRQRRGPNSQMSMLTGGSRDVKPQLLAFPVTQSAADTATTATQPLPVLRNFSSGNGSRAQILEILKVFMLFPLPAEVDSVVTCALTTKSFGTTAVSHSDPSVIAITRRSTQITTSGGWSTDQTAIFDLSDGNGNGLLVATDNIYGQVVSASTGAANAVVIRVLYRIYAADVTEYVGIVQGQQ